MRLVFMGLLVAPHFLNVAPYMLNTMLHPHFGFWYPRPGGLLSRGVLLRSCCRLLADMFSEAVFKTFGVVVSAPPVLGVLIIGLMDWKKGLRNFAFLNITRGFRNAAWCIVA
jgi:hypothetical protein